MAPPPQPSSYASVHLYRAVFDRFNEVPLANTALNAIAGDRFCGRINLYSSASMVGCIHPRRRSEQRWQAGLKTDRKWSHGHQVAASKNELLAIVHDDHCAGGNFTAGT